MGYQDETMETQMLFIHNCVVSRFCVLFRPYYGLLSRWDMQLSVSSTYF